eukprot:554148-Pyramimonas_sp.AAC.1
MMMILINPQNLFLNHRLNHLRLQQAVQPRNMTEAEPDLRERLDRELSKTVEAHQLLDKLKRSLLRTQEEGNPTTSSAARSRSHSPRHLTVPSDSSEA